MNTQPLKPLTEPQIELLITRYCREMARYEEAARLVEDRLRRELRANAVSALLSSRAKHPEDLRGKLKRKRRDARYRFKDLESALNEIVTDLAGCRVMLYQYADVARVKRVIDSTFQLASLPGNVEVHEKSSGYRALHYLVQISDDEERLSLQGAVCEIQVTSLAAHVFNELEHDIGYKDGGAPPTKPENDALQAVRYQSWLLDRSVGHLLKERSKALQRSNDVLENAEQLRFALEQAVERPLHGEFDRLYRMLDRVIDPLKATALTNLDEIASLLSRGKQISLKLQLTDGDDVVFLVLALMDTFGEEFDELVRSWRGPTTLIKRAVKAFVERRERP